MRFLGEFDPGDPCQNYLGDSGADAVSGKIDILKSKSLERAAYGSGIVGKLRGWSERLRVTAAREIDRMERALASMAQHRIRKVG